MDQMKTRLRQIKKLNIFKENSEVTTSKAMEKIKTTYSSFNLVRLVRVVGNSSSRLLALRILQSPYGNLRPVRLTLKLNY
jgi:hypothetical protein